MKTTADFAWTLNDGGGAELARRTLARSGNWKKLGPGSTRRDGRVGKTLGIVGFEDWTSGGAARERFQDEGDLYGCGARSEGVEKELKAEFREMNCVLAQSDFISVHVPLLPETPRLFDAEKFARMKQRRSDQPFAGPVVNEGALVAALEANKLRAQAGRV